MCSSVEELQSFILRLAVPQPTLPSSSTLLFFRPFFLLLEVVIYCLSHLQFLSLVAANIIKGLYDHRINVPQLPFPPSLVMNNFSSRTHYIDSYYIDIISLAGRLELVRAW